MSDTPKNGSELNRRQVLGKAALMAGALSLLPACESETGAGGTAEAQPRGGGRLKQSIVRWCFNKHWDLEKMCGVATSLGVKSIELIPPKEWPTLKKHGLCCAITGSHGFTKGFNNPANHEMCISKIKAGVDACADSGLCSRVITFTGFANGIARDEGMKNCVAGIKNVIGYCEKKKVDLCIEMLNSRVDVKMKGHPGYQGDHMDYCIELIKKVGSPRMKVLFDIYHVQIMDGDVISRIKQHAEYIGHIHTAGVPGRNELDRTQEINYLPIFETLADVGFSGYVGHEYIPTRDPLKGLQEAVALCNV